MTIPTINNVPSRTQNQDTFDSNVDGFISQLANEVIPAMNTDISSTIAAAATTSTNAAAAAISATVAQASANITKWVSGTNYTEGDVVWSPIDFEAYRRKVTGAGTTDPSLDTTNWYQLLKLVAENILYNGNMDHWQSYTAAVTTSGGYGADGFDVRVSGDTFSMTQQSFASGDDLYDGDGTAAARYYTQVDVTSVAGAGNFAILEQRVEDVRRLAGKTVTLSFWAKAAAGTPQIGVSSTQYFGTGGSPSANASTTGQAITLSTTWAKYTVTFTIANINGKTIGTDENSFTFIMFWLDAGSAYNTQSGSIGQASKIVSIAQVKLEEGSVATPFMVEDKEVSLVRAQRYFAHFPAGGAYTRFGRGIATSATNAYVEVTLPVTMRATPTTITQSGTAANYALLDSTGTITACSVVPTIIASGTSRNTLSLTCTTAGGMTAGPVQLIANNTTAAYIGVSARL